MESCAGEALRQAEIEAAGSALSVVASSDMDKAGAMVEGQPELPDGMGAQVWSLDSAGTMNSAGVIGPEPHEGVWMTLPGGTMEVMVTEEPVGGSQEPSGKVLARVSL